VAIQFVIALPKKEITGSGLCVAVAAGVEAATMTIRLKAIALYNGGDWQR
jgi:hypothetical protein